MSIFTYFKPLSTALLPNAESDDIKLVLKAFLPWSWNKWREGQEITELENKFSQYFGVRQAVSFSSGRIGLAAILSVIAGSITTKRRSNERNNEIILQAYTTIALPLVIKKAGFIPIYVDIKEETFNIDTDKIEAKITVNTRAIIIQHTFGIPAEMDKILALCKKHNLFLIEDCAHSFGAEYGEKKVGTFGDAAFFSFGRDKIISSTSGGMVISKNEELTRKIREFQNSLDFPPAKWIFQQLMHSLVFWFSLPVYYFFNIGKIKIFLAQKLGMIGRAYSQKEKEGGLENFSGYKFPNILSILILNQFKKMERYNNHRQKITEIYQKSFYSIRAEYDGKIKIPLVPQKDKSVFLYYTIKINNRNKMLKFAAEKHIILGDWFPGALGPKGIKEEVFGYKIGNCPIAEQVGAKSLNLPTNIKTSEADARMVVGVIKEFLDKN